MPIIAANIAVFFNRISLYLLGLFRYSVPQYQRNQKAIKATFSYIVPAVTAVLSFCMLEIAMIVFFANIVGLVYKFFTAVFSYQSYKRAFERDTSVARSLHETPLLIRAVLLFALMGFILLVVVLAVICPQTVSVDGAWMICACANIIITWIFETVDSLVAVYGAEIKNVSDS